MFIIQWLEWVRGDLKKKSSQRNENKNWAVVHYCKNQSQFFLYYVLSQYLEKCYRWNLDFIQACQIIKSAVHCMCIDPEYSSICICTLITMNIIIMYQRIQCRPATVGCEVAYKAILITGVPYPIYFIFRWGLLTPAVLHLRHIWINQFQQATNIGLLNYTWKAEQTNTTTVNILRFYDNVRLLMLRFTSLTWLDITRLWSDVLPLHHISSEFLHILLARIKIRYDYPFVLWMPLNPN